MQKWICVSGLVIAWLLLAGCDGQLARSSLYQTEHPFAGTNQQQPASQLSDLMLAMPEEVRSPSVLAGPTASAMDYDRSLPHLKTVLQQDSLQFNPDYDGVSQFELAFAIWSFDTSGFDQTGTVLLDWQQTHPDTSKVWLAVSDYSANRWRWSGVDESGVLAEFNPVPQSSPSEVLYLVVAVIGTEPWVLSTIELGVEPQLPLIRSVTPTRGISGSVVRFSADTSYGVENWNWDFGEGATPQTSTVQSPEVLLGAEDTYQASLTIMNGLGEDTIEFAYTSFNWYSGILNELVPENGISPVCLDTSGKIHVAYGSADGVFYATHDGSGWHGELLDKDGAASLSGKPAMTLDSLGLPHLTCFDTQARTLRYFHYDGSDWIYEDVTEQFGLSDLPSKAIAVDAADSPVIGYYWWPNGETIIATRDSGIWQLETIADGRASEYMYLAIDDSGVMHTTAYDDLYRRVIYRNSAEGWVENVINPVSQGGNYGAPLDVAEVGTVHICFSTSGKLAHASGTAGNWSIDYADTSIGVDKHAYIVLDSQDRPVIGYYHQSDNQLYIARWSESGWSREIAGSPVDVGLFTCMALDSNDQPVFTCLADEVLRLIATRQVSFAPAVTAVLHGDLHTGSVANFSLQYICPADSFSWEFGGGADPNSSDVMNPEVVLEDPGVYDCTAGIAGPGGSSQHSFQIEVDAWRTQAVYDVSTANGRSPSIQLDSNGYPHISNILFEGTFAIERYPQYAAWEGSQWIIETIDHDRQVAGNTSLELDPAGSPLICVVEKANSSLLLYSLDGSDWQFSEPDPGVFSDKYVSLALDVSGLPHISYRGDGYLKHAWFDGAVWRAETVDTAVSGAYRSSIAIDSGNRPCIAYDDKDNDSLRYASWNGASWNIEVVDSAEVGIACISLAVAADDTPHIAYIDSAADLFKYATHNGLNWQIEERANAPLTSDSVGIRLNSSGLPCIALSLDGVLYYEEFDGADWQSTVVSSNSQDAVSLVLDSSDLPHIAYRDQYLQYTYLTQP